MCFIVHPDYPKKLIAYKDILCYKVVNFNYTPKYYYDYKYNKYKVYNAFDYDGSTLKSLYISSYENTITFGIHSFSLENGSNIKELYETIEDFKNNRKSLYRDRDRVIYCVIPKGDKYYYNPKHGEYVSLRVRRIKESEFKKLLSDKLKKDK